MSHLELVEKQSESTPLSSPSTIEVATAETLDANQLAARIVADATGSAPARKRRKDPAAVALGRKNSHDRLHNQALHCFKP